MDDQRFHLLLATPDAALPDDVQAALEELAVGVTLHVAPDGDAVAAFLHAEAPYDGAAPPDLVLVDLDDERLWSVLDTLAADPELERLPLVALTSDEEGASRRLVGRRIHDVVPKPPSAERLREILSYLDEA